MKEFACKKCDRSFSVAGTLFAHYRMHMKLEFACTVCFEEFPSKTIFGVHRDSDESSCKAAKAIVKTSINQQQNDRNSAKKMLSLLDEFKIEVRVRGEMVVWILRVWLVKTIVEIMCFVFLRRTYLAVSVNLIEMTMLKLIELICAKDMI